MGYYNTDVSRNNQIACAAPMFLYKLFRNIPMYESSSNIAITIELNSIAQLVLNLFIQSTDVIYCDTYIKPNVCDAFYSVVVLIFFSF